MNDVRIVLVLILVSSLIPIPALGAVTSLNTDKEVYTIDDKIIFRGTDDTGNQFVHVRINSPSGAQVHFRSALADSDGKFELVAISVEDTFSSRGTYIATGFADDQRIENGTEIRLRFENDRLTLIPDILLELVPIGNKVIEEGKTLTFSVSVTDSSFTDLTYSLDKNPPSGASIDSRGKFTWTPSESQGPAGYSFDIVVSDGVQEDRQTIIIQVNEKETTEAPPKTKEQITGEQIENFLGYVDPKKDPQSYIDRYNNEPSYKEWFDRNFPDITIIEALNIEDKKTEPEPEPEPQPKEDKEKELAPFVDPNLDPQYYIDRYSNEPSYKEWFDRNFPDMTIYEAVGVEEEIEEEPEIGECGEGTKLVEGFCVPIEEQPEAEGGGCLIATATYGSELSSQVQFLRELRDNSLLKTSSGTSFMGSFNQFYYLFSPTVADWERQNPLFKETVKITITPLISTLSLLNLSSIDSEGEMVGMGLGIILLNIGMYFVAPFIAVRKISGLIKGRRSLCDKISSAKLILKK